MPCASYSGWPLLPVLVHFAGTGIAAGELSNAAIVQEVEDVRKMAKTSRKSLRLVARTAIAMALAGGVSLLVAPQAGALKYAKREHNIQPHPSIPMWRPAALTIEPDQEFHSVGADTMDEMTLGWVKMMRKAYPSLSVTMEARASGSGAPALVNGTAHVAPVARELLPAEEKAFVEKFGYKPTAFRVASGSAGSLGKTASSIIMVDEDNPITCLSLDQLDAIYSKDRLRGGQPIRTWGDLGLKGEWANRPIHLYGLRHPNGIEWYFRQTVLNGGEYRDGIEFVKGKGHSHAFNVAADDMRTNKGGLTYAMLANLQPNTKAIGLSQKTGGKCVYPTVQTVYDHSYPLSRYVYIFVNRKPGERLDPAVKEFLRAALSREGQQQVTNDGVFIPLMPHVVREELAKLDQM